MIEDSESNEDIERQSDVIDETFNSTNLPLGQWVNMPRRLQWIAREEVIDIFVDTEPLENHRTINETIRLTILHKGMEDFKKDSSSFESNL